MCAAPASAAAPSKTAMVTAQPQRKRVALKPPWRGDGLLPDVASLYRTPDLTPHSFPDPYVPVDQFESLNGATSDFSSQWPDPDSSIYSLPFEPLTTQMGYDTSQLETSQELLAHSTEKFDEPIFTTGLGNLLCTSSSPERTSFHNSTTSTQNRSPTQSTTPPTQNSTSKSGSSILKSAKSGEGDNSRIQKRTLNTLAARRYRQKRVDQMSELETALKETQAERDALKVRVARLEGEVDVLRGLLRP